LLKNWAEILRNLIVVQLILVVLVLARGVLEGDGRLCVRRGKGDRGEGKLSLLNRVVWKWLEGEGGRVDRAEEGLGRPRAGACRESTWCSCWGEALGLPGGVVHLGQGLFHQGEGCGGRAAGVRGGRIEEWDPGGVVVGGRGVGSSCGCGCMGGDGRVGIGYMSRAVTIGWGRGGVLVVIWGGTGGPMVRGSCWGAMVGQRGGLTMVGGLILVGRCMEG